MSVIERLKVYKAVRHWSLLQAHNTGRSEEFNK